MARFFREMTEESAYLSDGYETKTEKKHFGKVFVTFSEGKQNGHTYALLATKEDLFRNGEAKKRLTAELKKVFDRYFEKLHITEHSKILVVALGNEKVTCDSLGGRVAEKIFVTSHLYPDESVRGLGNVCALKCGVGGTTGIESFDLIAGAVKAVKPDLVIAVDTLASSSMARLGTVIQLSDGGIAPGSGVGKETTPITEDTLHVPVLALGVPLVIYLSKILAEFGIEKYDGRYADTVVAVKETDFICEDFACVIADALNACIHRRSFLFA